MQEFVWQRMGDNDDYEKHDSPYDAGETMGNYLGVAQPRLKNPPPIKKVGSYGISIDGHFDGQNYVSLFWGDDDAQPLRKMNREDMAAYRDGIKAGLR